MIKGEKYNAIENLRRTAFDNQCCSTSFDFSSLVMITVSCSSAKLKDSKHRVKYFIFHNTYSNTYRKICLRKTLFWSTYSLPAEGRLRPKSHGRPGAYNLSYFCSLLHQNWTLTIDANIFPHICSQLHQNRTFTIEADISATFRFEVSDWALSK